MITRWNSKVSIGFCVIEHLELAKQAIAKVSRNLPGMYVFPKEVFQPIFAPALDHLIANVPFGGTVV